MPAVATHHTALVAVLHRLARNVQEPPRPLIAILIHMEIQVQIPLLCKCEHPAVEPDGLGWDADDLWVCLRLSSCWLLKHS